MNTIDGSRIKKVSVGPQKILGMAEAKNKDFR